MDILNKHFFTNPDTPLHHYTTLKGFLGIINDGEIWATNIFYMNDQTELNRAIEFLNAELAPRIDVLKEERMKLGPRALGPETNSDILKIEAKLRFLEIVNSSASNIVKDNRIQFYVCSFAALDDSLSQWRGYCQDGNGISIGFDFVGFKTHLVLRKCNYNEDHQKQIVKELVDWWFRQLDTNLEANIKSESNKSNFGIGATISSHFVMECRNSFFRVAPFFKHPKYEEETEWRIVIGGEEKTLCENIKIVDSANILKPYYRINLTWLPKIKQVRVGPSSHIDLNESSTKLFLKSKDLNSDVVIRSGIPYRGKI